MKQSVWLGLAVSLVLLVLVFRNADFGQIGQALAGADYAVLGLGAALNLLTMGIRAARWQHLLAPIRRFGFWSLCSAATIGLMGNTLLPARSGELLRAYLVGRRGQIPFSSTLATIVVERLLDGLSFLLVVFVVVVAFPASPDWLRTGGYLAAALYLGLLVCLGLLATRPDPALGFARTVLGLLPARPAALADRWLSTFVDGLSSLRDLRRLALAGLYSLLLWFVFGVLAYIAARSLRLELSFFAAFVVLVALGIAATLPAAPGFVGTIQFFSVLGLGLFGVSAEDALSFSILYHAAYYLPVAIAGLFCLSLERLSLRDVRRGVWSLPKPPPP